jgi:hypothetical protein
MVSCRIGFDLRAPDENMRRASAKTILGRAAGEGFGAGSSIFL